MKANAEIILKNTDALLDVATEFWNKIPGCSSFLVQTDNLRRKLQQPCVLAVGGKVKAGKSSFINALLDKELAKVGELETTATINIFRHISEAGPGYSPERPVKVVWDSGHETWESISFMDSLQGNDAATLKRSEGISHLEFFEEHNLLKRITLVDTPGTDAVVGDDGRAHQKVVEHYFDLRQKHAEQTDVAVAKADAVIYLVGAVAGAQGKQFLEDFQAAASDASRINAMGVMSKVDVSEELLQNRLHQAESVADSLRDSLYTVVSVSAGMHEVIKRHQHRFPELQAWLKRMPQKAFEQFMLSDKLYLTNDQRYFDDWYKGSSERPPSVAERERMKGDIQWSLFRTVCRLLYQSTDCESALAQMHDISNIEGVKKTLDEYFFGRSKIIRCNSVLKPLRDMALCVRSTAFAAMRTNCKDLQSWLRIAKIGEQYEQPEAAKRLRQFILDNIPSVENIDSMEQDFVQSLIIPIENLQQDLLDVDGDYCNLIALQSRRSLWPDDDYDELCTVFGLYGGVDFPDGFDFAERQAYWQMKALRMRDRRDRALAEYAVECYGRLIMQNNNNTI